MYTRTGDNQWLAALLERYTLVLLGYCMRSLHNMELAKDAVQQVQLKVIRYVHRQKITSFPAWLFAIARNECVLQHRKQQRLLRDIIEADPEAIANPEVPEGYERARLDRHLPDALDRITEPQRDCILLFYLHQLSYQDISDKTGYSLKEVKSHIQNGKRNLKKILEQYE